MTDQIPLIELKDVTLHYGSQEIVRDVNLKVWKGEAKVILGPSGVGKSTILKAVLGLLKPKSGQVLFHGKDISHLSERELIDVRSKMAMVFQNGALFDAMTVADNVSFRMRELRLASDDVIHRRVMEVLSFVGLQGSLKLKPSQLSGGMRKRVAIARALAPDPECFLFDEPTVGLDPLNLFNIEQLILKLKARKSTLIMVTHDVESAMKIANTIVMLHHGKFIFEGSPDELKQSQDKRITSFLDPASAYAEQGS